MLIRRVGSEEVTSPVPGRGENPLAGDINVDLLLCFVYCRAKDIQDIGRTKVQIIVEGHASDSQIIEPVEYHPKASGVGMCVGPVLAQRPTVQDWLGWYTALGVSGIHAYTPSFDSSTELYKAARNEQADGSWKGKESHHLRLAERHREQLFSHHLLTWQSYHYDLRWLKEESAHAFCQRALYNDCLMRHRYKYRYLLFFDMDEFLEIRNLHHESIAPSQRALETLLDQHDTPNTAELIIHSQNSEFLQGLAPVICHEVTLPFTTHRDGAVSLQIFSYDGYPTSRNLVRPDLKNCSVDWEMINKHSHRWCHSKPILKPQKVKVQWVHNAVEYENPSVDVRTIIPGDSAFLNHVRC